MNNNNFYDNLKSKTQNFRENFQEILTLINSFISLSPETDVPITAIVTNTT